MELGAPQTAHLVGLNSGGFARARDETARADAFLEVGGEDLGLPL